MSEMKNDISTKARSRVAEIMQLAIGVTPITAKEMRATTNSAEEMADVIIMLTQLSLIFENHDEVKEFIDFKLKREEERLEHLKTEVSEYDC